MAGRRGAIIASIAGIAAVATVVTLAVTANGYEAQEVPQLETSIWVTRDAGQYARVNTDLAEIDLVRDVDDPSTVVQSGSTAAIYSQGLRQRWAIDPAEPVDLVAEDGGGSVPTPTGTRDVVTAGDWVAYRTDTGTVHAGRIDGDDAFPVDPYAEARSDDGGDGEGDETYAATAVGVSSAGLIAMYSAREEAVRLYDASTGEFTGGEMGVPEPPAADASLELTVLGERWVMLDPADGRVWLSGRDAPVALDVAPDARLQQGSGPEASVHVADSAGLVELPLDGGDADRVVEASGAPAHPILVGDELVAAWLSTDGGAVWTSSGGETVPLEVPEGEAAGEGPQSLTPVLRGNGDRAVLNETSSGIVWTVPDGRVVPLEQWELDDEIEDRVGTEEVEDLARQEPPVAVADSFGVRSGQQVELPVLYNDHDPNAKDVLTVDPASITGGFADPAFGELALTSNDQTPTVRVRAESGSTTFTYAVTDGSASSAPVTVTLTVVPSDVNSAPVWCGVDDCLQTWPEPQLMPGGTALVSVLPGWVDPEGDAFVLADAQPVDASAPVTVVPMADGRVAIRHTDPNAAAEKVQVRLTVADVNGAATEATLDVRVTTSASLEVAPVAVTAGAGETAIVDIAEHVSGGSGSLRLLDAVPTAAAAGAGLVVVPNAAAGEVELSAEKPGAYLATFTVQDLVTRAEQTATIRVTVAAPGAPVALAPMTAFVRAGEDTMVDVLGAAQNTSGRVLVVTGAVSGSPELGVGVVAQSQVRVTGVTRNGEPGLVGRAKVTVADGAGATATGDLSVFLVAPSAGISPIAMPDTVTMRVGELISIPVTDNDVSPRAEALVVHPEVSSSGADGELAFASGDEVRYLAPKTPGTYELGYAVGLAQAPERLDHSTVTVTVLPDGANRAPEPHPLVARVLSGQSVRIPVPSTGMDPDGDRTVLVGVAQPKAGLGIATISAEGDAIVYTAPENGTGDGQPSFEYTVRDASGSEGEGRVRVGVLTAAVTDAAPVTFSDYVRVQQSAASPVTVEPAGNDLDPAQGELELVKVVPNAPEGSPEHDRLAALIDPSTDPAAGRVVLHPGDVAGSNSYRYTVRSERTSSTAEGLIVVKVTEGESPDAPVVADTVVTARSRADLPEKGLDVIAGHVTWASGDLAALELELWGKAPSGFRVEGHRIIGPLPDGGALVPFRVHGADRAGRDAEAFGFLVVPATDDLRVQLRGDLDDLEVKEDAKVSFDVRELLDLAPGDSAEVGTDGYTVQRANATCRPVAGGGAEYAAGRDAPWSDHCLVPVRLDGQKSWSWVGVPIAIVPRDPQAILSAVSRTVAPGASESVALYDEMTTWEGGREGDRAKLDYSISYSGSAFTVEQKGEGVTFEAHADARPGTRETATVSVSAFGGLTSAITLVVGQAPPDTPRGAVFTQQCSVGEGASCTIAVVGVPGEYDPFSGKTGAGLKLAGLGSGANSCQVASIRAVDDRSVTVTWPTGKNAFGGECVVPFSVTDAQGRSGDGRLTVDLLGLPQAPASVSTADYTANSVTLEVSLGEALRAHPEVIGVEILEGERAVRADCKPGAPGVWWCTVGGLTPGERHRFAARAVNSVGVSTATSPVETWSYKAPVISAASASPVYREGTTGPNTGVVELRISAERDARSFRVQETGQVIDRRGATTTTELTLVPGPQMLTLVPISIYEPPTGRGGNEGGNAVVPITAAGSPVLNPNGIAAAAASNTSILVTGVGLDANHSARASELVYLAWQRGDARCWADGDGGLQTSGAEVVSSSSTIAGLQDSQRYYIKACASNGYGVVETETVRADTIHDVDPPSGTLTYTVATAPAGGGDHFEYRLEQAPVVEADNGFTPYFYMYGEWREDFVLETWGTPGDVKVRTCKRSWFDTKCSGDVAIVAKTAPTEVTVDFATGCIPSQDEIGVTVSDAARGSYEIRNWRQTDPTNAPLAVAYDLVFTGAFIALDPIPRTGELCPPPEPTPTPTPTPTPEAPAP
ncbi:Ig-like domain-containing protein [Agromyces sp. S2-1-8]|uniref:Ig-like domain-containing protein n=1 Tax=Agromyces sp. S2-1-8 TaxID=2897180 RepID=UPI001E49F0A1|nr:Ig-like domain-containing protein [Agromyces sp. S2-1-8]MCD5345246.1 Ig-like domain-containing protein [Agromyces sp. S2-1-8]